MEQRAVISFIKSPTSQVKVLYPARYNIGNTISNTS